MGTKVQDNSCFGGYNPMRDLNGDLNEDCWPLFSGESNIPSYTRLTSRTTANVYPGYYDKDALKQKMLEHDAILKNQVHELHRLYKIHRDMMEEIKTKEHYRHGESFEPSSASSIQGSHVPAEGIQKFHNCGYPCVDYRYPTSSVSRAENVSSPLSYKKGNSTLASQVAFHGFHKDFEVSEARPSKVSKKMFDLQLPAEEYIDTEDDVLQNISGDPSFTPSNDYKSTTESSTKITVGGFEMFGLKEGCSSVSHFKGSTGLVDLNEPIDIEEVPESSPANIFRHSACNGRAMHKSTRGNQENKINGRGCSSYSYVADHSEEVSRTERLGGGLVGSHISLDYSNHNLLEPLMASQVCNAFPFKNSSNDSGIWPQLMQSLGTPTDSMNSKLTSFHTHPSLSSSPSLNKGLQSSALSNHIPRDKVHVNRSFRSNPCLASDLPSSHNGFYQGSFSGSNVLPVCFSSIGNDTASALRRNGMEKAFLSSSFVDIKPLKDMNLNATFPKIALDMPVILQDLDSADGNCQPEVHQPLLPWLRTKPTFNNEATSSRRDVIYIDESPPHASPSLLSGKDKAILDLNQVYNDTSASNNHTRSKNETNEIPIVKRIFGFPIFENLGVSEDNVSALVSSTTEVDHAKHERRSRLIDINVPSDASLLESEEPVTNEMVGENHLDRNSWSRNFIDLNTYVAEDEDPPVPTVAIPSDPREIVVEIDLEVPGVPEDEDDFLPERDRKPEQDIILHPPDNDSKQEEDEAIRSAAEVIVNVSSCQDTNQESVFRLLSDTSEVELLLWFADVVSTSPTFEKEGSYKVMDEFEAMTLQLPETKEEDFMPQPFIPEVQKVEEGKATALPNRPRRGQGRRGRQRRDFQRDILPGLVSLSRHEVTEDLQTFRGLMRAMGHSWNSGLTRRNGGRHGSGKGRWRTVEEAGPAVPPVTAACTQLMQQLDNVEPTLEDRSLTGWGKTTRRPRRQRCSISNAPTVALS